jgi:hypothetical protein
MINHSFVLVNPVLFRNKPIPACGLERNVGKVTEHVVPIPLRVQSLDDRFQRLGEDVFKVRFPGKPDPERQSLFRRRKLGVDAFAISPCVNPVPVDVRR